MSRSRRLRPAQQRLGALGSVLLVCAGCSTAPQPGAAVLAAAARANAFSLSALPLDLFGRREMGWAVYAPRVEATLHVDAPADAAAFAAALARWQRRHGLRPNGIMDAGSLLEMKRGWQAERPFVALRAKGVCPASPTAARLRDATAAEGLGGKRVRLRAGALAAYRRLLHSAVATRDARLAPPRLLLFSGFRDPAADAARCAREGNCQGVARAACSAHRTGLALDLALDTAPGFAVDDSADANRLAMARSYAYRWLLVNAPRQGFVNYAFEPWHWEWTGAAP